MSSQVQIVGFDADDTLWHNERSFQRVQEAFARLLADYAAPEELMRRLRAAEQQNLLLYGYGVKGFVLSMIETAMEVTQSRVAPHIIGELIALGQEMLSDPVALFPGAREALSQVAAHYRTVLITKGDLLDQERKVAQSGLGQFFAAVEVVSEKTAPVYRRIFERHGAAATGALMVGNSMRSDVLPVIELGGWGVHIPQELEWAHERAPAPKAAPRFVTLSSLAELPALLASIG